MAEREIRRRNRPNTYSDDHLLTAAADVFHRAGFQDASMVDIAAHAGVTKPTLYARFGGKERLYDLVLERVAESMLAVMGDVYRGVGGQGLEDSVERPAAAFFGWVRANPGGFHLLFTDDRGAPTGSVHRERALMQLTGLVNDANTAYLAARGLKPGWKTSLIAAQVVGLFQQGGRWIIDNDPRGRRDVTALTAQLIAGGLRAIGPEAARSAAVSARG